MGPNQGVVYVAFGHRAVEECKRSLASLRLFHDWPVAVVSDEPVDGTIHIECDRPGWGARGAKLNLNNLVPPQWRAFLYIDADTRVCDDLAAGFQIIEDGWDLAITASQHQEDGWLWHLSEPERQATANRRMCGIILQAGLWFAARNERTDALFALWREEWAIYGRNDQGALLRALGRCTLRLWVLGRDWNGGKMVQHLWGRARQ
jgi:hypothetical protein